MANYIHTVKDLRQAQLSSLDSLIRMTIQRAKDFTSKYDSYISISGKDSTVMAHIIKNYVCDIPMLYVNTGLEYTGVREHAEKMGADIRVPKMNVTKVITKFGYPVFSKETSQKLYEIRTTKSEKLRNKRLYGDKKGNGKLGKEYHQYIDSLDFYVSHYCCIKNKKEPAKLYEKETGRKPIVGTLADESILRLTTWLKNGCNTFSEKRAVSRPLSQWTEWHVLEYIRRYNVEIPKEYGEIIEDESKENIVLVDGEHKALKTTGCDRTGCIYCPLGAQYENGERFRLCKQYEPKKYEFAMNGGSYNDSGIWTPDKNGLGLKHVLDALNIKY